MFKCRFYVFGKYTLFLGVSQTSCHVILMLTSDANFEEFCYSGACQSQSTFPFIIDKYLVERIFETILMSYLLLLFYTLI